MWIWIVLLLSGSLGVIAGNSRCVLSTHPKMIIPCQTFPNLDVTGDVMYRHGDRWCRLDSNRWAQCRTFEHSSIGNKIIVDGVTWCQLSTQNWVECETMISIPTINSPPSNRGANLDRESNHSIFDSIFEIGITILCRIILFFLGIIFGIAVLFVCQGRRE